MAFNRQSIRGVNKSDAQGAFWLISIVLLFSVAYFFGSAIIDFIKKLSDPFGTKKADAAKQSEVDAIAEKVRIKYLTFDKSVYTQKAGRLYNAMAFWGTDFDAIIDVLYELYTPEDYRQLWASFGLKDGKTLGEWFDNELSVFEKQQVAKYFYATGLY
jgi:hypothetical protein